jgi:hypothetical protein
MSCRRTGKIVLKDNKLVMDLERAGPVRWIWDSGLALEHNLIESVCRCKQH